MERAGFQQIAKRRRINAEDVAALVDEATHILYILDGYDEIANLSRADSMYDSCQRHPVWNLFAELTGKARWIVTSRPHHMQNFRQDCAGEKVDRELEVMGFIDKNIPKYITCYFKSESAAEVKKGHALTQHLQANRAVWGIAHIPIQLALICYVWQHDSLWQKANPSTITMTILYTQLNQRLLSRYLEVGQRGCERRIAYLKSEYGDEFAAYVNDELRDDEVLTLCQREQRCLGMMAIRGLVTGDLLLPKVEVEQVLQYWSKRERKRLSLQAILAIGLLKEIAATEGSPASYYFLHLTFQEFYAAWHIVEAFSDGTQPWGLAEYRPVGQAQPPYPTVVEFIQRYKFDEQYEVVWWFVVGLLANKGEQHAKRFFDLLEQAPYDVLGLRQASLSIRLLEEYVTDAGQPGLPEERHNRWLRHADHQLTQIAKYGYYARRYDNGADSVLQKARQSLISSVALSARLVKEGRLLNALAPPAVERGEYQRAVIIFLKELGKRHVELPESLIVALTACLTDLNTADRDLIAEMAGALGAQTSLPEPVLLVLVARLKHGEEYVVSAVADALSKQTSLPERVVFALTHLAENGQGYTGIAAYHILDKQTSLSEPVVLALAARLESAKGKVRAVAAVALGKQTSLSEPVVLALAARLDDVEEHVRIPAARALGEQTSLPELVVRALVARLKDASVYVRAAVAESLFKIQE